MERRAALSAAHTACHLAALALDSALAGAWSKTPPTDALGNPAFDALAIQQSRIQPLSSVDVYRIGRSLRRKGFNAAALNDPAGLAVRVNDILAQWISVGGPVRIERTDDALSARRMWVCELPAGSTNIPCGGTHVRDIGQLDAITVRLTRKHADSSLDAGVVNSCLELEMETRAAMAVSA
ncbi:hypothetical protein [Microbacterium azadirachtae]|uniref:hypothetical protein n=1 Tax=Microbacterium azadirachtae TaxID=582680 RepID=UPI000A6E08EC|nr:hypothetical protein [Microbacterium azadirachtae]